MAFLSEDVQKAVDFGKFIEDNASWSLNTKDAIQLTRHLNFYNKVVQEINEHVMELRKITEAEPKPGTPAPMAKKRSKTKAKPKGAK